MSYRFGVISLFLTIQLVIAAPCAVLALDSGGCETGVIFDAQQSRTSGEEFFLSDVVGFVDFHQSITNYGVLEGRLAISQSEQQNNNGAGANSKYRSDQSSQKRPAQLCEPFL